MQPAGLMLDSNNIQIKLCSNDESNLKKIWFVQVTSDLDLNNENLKVFIFYNGCAVIASNIQFIPRLIIIIIIIIIWFGDTVTVSHFTKCNTNSKVRALS